ncbi:kelch-like protein 2 isoform X1, partial [Aphis craccivora]
IFECRVIKWVKHDLDSREEFLPLLIKHIMLLYRKHFIFIYLKQFSISPFHKRSAVHLNFKC